MKNILLLPIDNRPVTYTLSAQIAAIYKNVNLFMPDRKFLGGLLTSSNREKIIEWLKNKVENEKIDFIILSLDTFAYGGLVPSRRCPDSFDEIKTRLEILKEILKTKKCENPNLKIYATSSIMRISNNNENEEEKIYWSQFGKEIFEYSYFLSKNAVEPKNSIPKEILNDYLSTRKRNFDINLYYLDWLKENILDFLVFSKDDTGKYGLNVQEAKILENKIEKQNLNAIVKTGADEIPLGLMLRAIVQDMPLRIKILYEFENSADNISRYEDIPVKDCIPAQIFLGVKNAVIVDENPDLILYVNNFENIQGDCVFQDVINSYSGILPDFNAPYVIADINNANGADNILAEKILDKKMDENFLGYSAYNTSANSIGSALALGICTYLARKDNLFDKKAFLNLVAIRFLDDWGYQANIRKNLKEYGFSGFKPYEEKIKNFTGMDFEVKYSLPWNRSFEIEIELE